MKMSAVFKVPISYRVRRFIGKIISFVAMTKTVKNIGIPFKNTDGIIIFKGFLKYFLVFKGNI